MIQATLDPPPYSTEAFELIEPIRAAVGGAALVGGATAVEFDVRQAAAWDSLVIPPIVLLVVFVILMLLLRAVIGPLVLIGTVILSYAAALGVRTPCSTSCSGSRALTRRCRCSGSCSSSRWAWTTTSSSPPGAREETYEHGTRRGCCARWRSPAASSRSAGIVLAGTFAVLGSLPLVFLTEIGFVVAFGVLLDTFLVRSVLVPAATLLIGPKFWWPSHLAEDRRRRPRGGAGRSHRMRTAFCAPTAWTPRASTSSAAATPAS